MELDRALMLDYRVLTNTFRLLTLVENTIEVLSLAWRIRLLALLVF